MPPISITDLEKSNVGPVWVLNVTRGETRSVVQFSVPKVEGQGYDAVVVPVTIAPINLAEQVSKRQIMQSSQFRKAALRGLLSIISEQEASEMLKDPKYKRAYEKMQSEFTQISQGETQASTGASPVLSTGDTNQTGVSARVSSFASLLSESADEEESLTTLLNLGELTEAEKDVVRKAAAEKNFRSIVDALDGK